MEQITNFHKGNRAVSVVEFRSSSYKWRRTLDTTQNHGSVFHSRKELTSQGTTIQLEPISINFYFSNC